MQRLSDPSRPAIGCALTALNTRGFGFREKVYDNAHQLEVRTTRLNFCLRLNSGRPCAKTKREAHGPRPTQNHQCASACIPFLHLREIPSCRTAPQAPNPNRGCTRSQQYRATDGTRPSAQTEAFCGTSPGNHPTKSPPGKHPRTHRKRVSRTVARPPADTTSRSSSRWDTSPSRHRRKPPAG